jgi:glyoxylase-like metal-dependent hydrolase (beta-lactamase superfamily II)
MSTMLPGAEELAPGLTRWVAFHPEWKQEVACVAVAEDDRLVLVDPLAPPEPADARRFWRALDAAVRARAAVDVVVTLHYHRRSAAAVVDRYRRRAATALWAPVGSVARVGANVDHALSPGEALPGGIEARASGHDGEVVLWLPRQRALVSGDVLLGGVRKPYRVCPKSWLPAGVTRAGVAKALRPLLDLPVELLVPTHGPPVTSGAAEALAAALADAAR